ncbi:hypothetical protein INN71_08415 [Nocardioides sp. ChNu-153]|uniref:hypothetical protein n=1 Tax=unclassified Nocardioides TaxID=2615069 RepID=UPI002406E5D0|nr:MULTISPECIES: hypothetical protein [unclassified Nocardioides]MDF9716996.1 hypothetical protein [Nocardioides sp. ChNu-99]MDN7121414.1 hypothetical protein [Nocardioides sp. ChNu-153]
MPIPPDRVELARAIGAAWAAELEPRVARWSLLLSAGDVELARAERDAYDGGGTLAPFLALQVVERDLATVGVLLALARGARSDLDGVRTVLEVLGGADAVNERLRRGGNATRAHADGSSSVVPAEHAEAVAALTGNPAYADARTVLLGHRSAGLAAALAPEGAAEVGPTLWHARATSGGVRHDGGLLVLADGSELAVHCFTELRAEEPADGPSDGPDEVLDAVARAFTTSLRLLGHRGLVDPG